MAKQNKIPYLAFIGKVAKIRMTTIKNYNPNVVYTTNIRNFRIRRHYPASRCNVDYDQLSKVVYVGGFCKEKKCIHPFRQCKNCSYNIQY